MNSLNIIILAAGKGTRMHSKKPKVLHKIGNESLLKHVIICAKTLNPNKIIVIYGFGGEEVKSAIDDEQIIWVEQAEQKGTGHAVQQAIPYLDSHARSLILLGDVPLINPQSCQELVNLSESALSIMTFIKEDPTGYGRIVRNSANQVQAIVEHKDANELQRDIKEVNTGIMALPNAHLKKWLNQLNNQNAQGEYYLTDIVGFAVIDKVDVNTEITDDEWAVTGVNSKTDLSLIERVYQLRLAEGLLKQGVTLKDKHRIDIRGSLICGNDVIIDVNCVFEGKVKVGDDVEIGPNCVIKDAVIQSGTKIASFTNIDSTTIGAKSRIGPYARLRPGTYLGANTHIGNFVELKNAHVGEGSKVNHLSYVGDSEVGKNVNIGAGTITCNYDGANKFKTIIEDDVFVGSDTQLIAPVKVGKGATIGAGSTITKNVPENSLTICRAKEQKSILGWKRPTKIKK